MSQDSGDAFSTALDRRLIGTNGVDQGFAPLDLGYMRGVLLAVLCRDEYAERIATHIHNDAVREELRAPSQSYVRITDLRLATSPKLAGLSELKKALEPLLRSLEKPVTPNGVLQWKRDLLWEDEEARGRRPEEQDAKIVQVSFGAAALLLFLDFNMPDIEGADPSRLARQIGELADITRKLSKSLDANARKLEKLLAYRDQNRPSAPGQNSYEALVVYRMGKELCDVAETLGIKPYKSSPSKSGGSDFDGTKQWRSRLEKELGDGAKIEKEKYPRATSVFENRTKPRIEYKARLAYRVYQKAASAGEEQNPRLGDRFLLTYYSNL